MKSFIQAIAVAAVLAVPAVSFAQSSAPDTSAAVQNTAASGYGGVADDTSASGSHHPLRALDHSFHSMGHAIRASIRPDPNDGMKPIYFGN
ncbi:MAG: hypothetical protein JO371_01955 [Paraburkholderia sp.]|nr:hypothetical protein [Paraburkholderia sp.]